jgi:HEAT repeat protein
LVVSLRALIGFLLPRRWKGALAEVKRLLAAERPAPEGLGPRLDRWLESPGWEVRNAAVKLVAHVREEARYPRLLQKLGDRRESGIVRRNVAEVLSRIGLKTPEARTALLAALDDPDWEVRAEAAHALAVLFDPAEDLEAALLRRLSGAAPNARRRVREENFEVRMALAEGLGALGVSRAALDALRALAADHLWIVRCQAAVGLAHLATRRPEFRAEARTLVLGVDRLSEGAISYFVHRDILSHTLQSLRKEAAEVPPEELRALYLSAKVGWNHLRRGSGRGTEHPA